ncbi:retrovirus-related pol polyprotein from transposon TNT 1-94 [Tanacetum coccineum]
MKKVVEPYNAVEVTILLNKNDCDRVELEKLAKKVSNERDKQAPSTPVTRKKQEVKIPYEAAGVKARSNTKKIGSCLLRRSIRKTSEIWKQTGKLSDNSLYKTKRVWKATGIFFADIGYQWRPTGKKLTLGKLNCGSQWRPTGKKCALGEMYHLTKPSVKCRTGHALVSGLRLLKTYDGESFKAHEFCGKVHRVRQFCDSDLEVAFRKHTCFVRDIKGTYILKGSRGTNLYTISIDEMMKSSPICLLSKASKSKSWLWHRRLNHLNFGTINDLARKDLVRGLPRLKFEKDHLCSACQLGKRKKFSHRPKSENTNMEVLHTLHMDLCGPMRVQSIKGKKYILVIDPL